MKRTGGWTDESTIDVAAPPERLWQLVADVTRVGEWSPVCRRCEWAEGSVTPEVGARFVGHSRRGLARWSRLCEVTVSDPGSEFAFRTFFKGTEATRWRYRFEPTSRGTRVTESYVVVSMPRWVRLLNRVPGAQAKTRRDALDNMTTTLKRLASIASRSER